MKILLFCDYNVHNAAMVIDHIQSFSRFSCHDVFVHKKLVHNQGELENDLNLNWFDVIVVHYSIFIGVDAYLSRRSKARLKASRGLKVVFLQDEYRFVQRSIDGLVAVDAHVVFTCVPERSIDKVYNDPRLVDTTFVNTLTGYVSGYLINLPPIELKKRKYDVSYRGRCYPDWHGAMGLEKCEIGKKFLKMTRGSGLKTNISVKERRRVYGAAWIRLIQQSRAVLGVESGSSVFDFFGIISAKTETKRDLLGRKGVSYEILREQYFAEVENAIDLAQISPRIFEAIALRTLCILYEGEYSGLLKPYEHYLPLKKNFSNIDEIISRLNDTVYVSEVIANAYAEIAHDPSLSYASFVSKFDEVIERESLRNIPVEHPCSGRSEAEIDSTSIQNFFRGLESGSGSWIRRIGGRYLPRSVKTYFKKYLIR